MESMKILVITGTDIVKSTYELIDSVEYIRQNHLNTPSFEIGYLMFNTFELYRKMIDKYNTSLTMDKKLYTVEHLMYLEEIENHYWEVDHLTSMLHEIERKYNTSTNIHSKYTEKTSAELHEIAAKNKEMEEFYRGPSTLRKIRVKQKVLDRLKPTIKRTWKRPLPKEYGWDYPDHGEPVAN